MSSWLPVAKAILPYVSDIISVAKPVFTHRKGNNPANQIEILQEQVEQLQTATLQNTHDIKALAEQFKTALPALEKEIWDAHTKAGRAQLISVVALIVALLASVIAVIALVR
ncbi:hypothetical protein [Glaciimonas soli]|uniref:Uncharacterized protein n=1 Tax=Glaciimonas soli TaxID=2590999 RepID=A0A843YUW2_9BURK|nr:hypothetical protein [Glaciimonas soli]MQR01494.1 hypothetical protein [Glaciimonas soli]